MPTRAFSIEDGNIGTKTIQTNRRKVFSDIDLTFAKRPSGDIFKKQHAAAVKQAVKNLLLTNFGEKPFMYDIESLINCSRVINISSNNFIQSNFSYDYINTNSIFNNNFFLKKKLVKYKKTNESIYNLSKKLLEANI